MIHPIPGGTRDVLPDEMRELRELSDRLRAVFERAGYGEVWTPAIEYEEVLRRGDERAAGAGFRLFDDRGNLLALRSDMTIPIARVVATRYAEAPPPIRLCYFAHSYRAVERGQAQQREFLQAGVELVGAHAPEGDAEVIALVVNALSEAGLRRHRIGVGDGDLYRGLLEALDVPADDRARLLEALSRRDLVGLEARVGRLGLEPEARRLLVELPAMRGGPEVLERVAAIRGGPELLERAESPLGGPIEKLRALHAQLAEQGVADRVIFDLGLVRELGYYTGAVLEVYDPAVGFALGGGGRYDDLLGRFGRPLPACGVALDVTRVHIAQAEEERLR
jgi:ATP phosphoribosyltransferase regulatory subunit